MNPITKLLPDFCRRARTQLLPITCLTISLMNSSSIQSFAAEWERVASLPESNGGFVSGEINGEVIIASGTNWKDDTKQWLSSIHAYDPTTNKWRQIGTLEAPLAYGVSGQDAQALWFASGSSGTSTHRSVLRIDKSLTATRAHKLDTGFVYAGGAVTGSTLYVLGGADDQASLEKTTNALLAIDLGNGTTTRLSAYPEPGFVTGAVATCAGRLFAFGGARWDAEAKTVANLSSAHTYYPAEKRWGKVATVALPDPGHHRRRAR